MLINIFKVFPDVTFQNETGLVIIRSEFDKITERLYRFILSFSDPRSIRIRNEFRLIEREEIIIQNLMNHPISHFRFINISFLIIKNLKMLIR